MNYSIVSLLSDDIMYYNTLSRYSAKLLRSPNVTLIYITSYYIVNSYDAVYYSMISSNIHLIVDYLIISLLPLVSYLIQI